MPYRVVAAAATLVMLAACTPDHSASARRTDSAAATLPPPQPAAAAATAAFLAAEGQPLMTLTNHAGALAATPDQPTCRRTLAALGRGPAPDTMLALAGRVEDQPLREALTAERAVLLEVLHRCAAHEDTAAAAARLAKLTSTVRDRLATLGVTR